MGLCPFLSQMSTAWKAHLVYYDGINSDKTYKEENKYQTKTNFRICYSLVNYYREILGNICFHYAGPQKGMQTKAGPTLRNKSSGGSSCVSLLPDPPKHCAVECSEYHPHPNPYLPQTRTISLSATICGQEPCQMVC